MTVTDLFSVIINAHQIKRWPNEYRVYSKTNIAYIYCDKLGNPTHYIYHTNGVPNKLSADESKIISTLLGERYALLYQNASRAKTK